jgi:hypothetical protein
VPNERKLTLALKGLNPQVQVVPCSFEIVTEVDPPLELDFLLLPQAAAVKPTSATTSASIAARFITRSFPVV